MKKAIILLIIVVSFTSCRSPVSYPQYVIGAEDIPVPQGFSEKSDDTTAYDTVSGRIIDALYEGQAAVSEVRKFYDKTLPELGWKKMSYSLYEREEESLSLDIKSQKGGKIQLRFTIRPSLDK